MSQATIVVEGSFREGYEAHFAEYSGLVRAYLEKNQGTVVRRQLVKKTLYGSHNPDLIMVVDFPSEELAEGLFFAQEYLDIIPLRNRIFADFRMYLARYGEI
ncbi:DUF1330 domain-containing protein [Pseudofrankia asymbiotica]|uniref:DUF1330 domain-containing protein n=1 Tax=Pseudofrankia asymbiotica TaxID=1834516 RepID=A0A1V2IC47_9ACTN|nr:DUF1330 domain-containing protein [Pseudofrankia asymbiotica]ONH30459.1 hypothetical protein BL253_13245 [Pseudofrankia asymbiotica]